MSRIKAFIETYLSDARFDLGVVALKFNVTPRQAQKLFQAEKTTFSRYVLARCLEMARMLVLRSSDRPISSIAYEIGFGDLSYFNRAFRQRFEMTPSAMRKLSPRRETTANHIGVAIAVYPDSPCSG
ncbi:helix-turn-helix transcriptional regulator [Brucellaceae bacterium D45D]